MADTPATPKAGAKMGWTDTEKLGILFQIIQKMDKPIPWGDLDLPEGRTLKAVQVMIDKEKAKAKKAKEAAADGEDGEATGIPVPVTPASKAKKRGPKTADVEGEEPKVKKARTPRKKKVKAGEDEGTALGADDEVKIDADDAAAAMDGASVKGEAADDS